MGDTTVKRKAGRESRVTKQGGEGVGREARAPGQTPSNSPLCPSQ